MRVLPGATLETGPRLPLLKSYSLFMGGPRIASFQGVLLSVLRWFRLVGRTRILDSFPAPRMTSFSLHVRFYGYASGGGGLYQGQSDTALPVPGSPVVMHHGQDTELMPKGPVEYAKGKATEKDSADRLSHRSSGLGVADRWARAFSKSSRKSSPRPWACRS
jgi:hypothetical protein